MAKLSDVLGTSFDSSAVEPREDFSELLPSGVYVVEITDAEVKTTKAGTGQYIKLEHTVIDPAAHAKRKVWKAINVTNPNPEAERIGRSELAGLARAMGIVVTEKTDTDEFVGKVVKVKVGIRKGKDGYADQNEVKAYESALTAPVPNRAPPAQVNSRQAPPWAK